jgi:hypothetical protein
VWVSESGIEGGPRFRGDERERERERAEREAPKLSVESCDRHNHCALLCE